MDRSLSQPTGAFFARTLQDFSRPRRLPPSLLEPLAFGTSFGSIPLDSGHKFAPKTEWIYVSVIIEASI